MEKLKSISELPISTVIEVGTFFDKAEKLLTIDIGWEPQRQLAKLWLPRLARMRTDLSQLALFNEPTLIVAVTGGVKAGKTYVANTILGSRVLAESLRHETRRAWVVCPPGMADQDVFEILSPAKSQWLRFVKLNAKIGDRNLILIDLPDFDSESRLADFRENQQIVESVLSVADVIILVSSQAHNLTGKTFDWISRFREGHGFIFVYNQSNGAEGTEAQLRIDQLRQQVIKAGFEKRASVIGTPYAPDNYDGRLIVPLLEKLPANRVLRCWRVAAQIHQLTQDMKTIYSTQQSQLESVRKNIETYIARPLEQQLKTDIQSQIKGMLGTFQREMLFRLAGRIGGIFGGFLSLRRFFNYWSLPGLWLGSRLMGPTGTLVATGSLVFGSIWRSFEAWRDRRQLKSKPLQPQYQKQENDLADQRLNINLELEHIKLDPLPDALTTPMKKQQDERKQQIEQTIESAFNAEISGSAKGIPRRVQSWGWRLFWNLIPVSLLTYAFIMIFLSLVNGFPFFPEAWRWQIPEAGFSFYFNIIAALVGICYAEYLVLLLILRKAAKRVGKRILEELTNLEHPFLANLMNRLHAPDRFSESAKMLEQDLEQLLKLLRSSMKGVEIAE